MIRMGRSSKKDETSNNDTSEFQEQPATTHFPFPNETQTSSTRAISESESMARDIKEGRLSGFVGAGTVLTGETNFDSMLRVDGHLTGKVVSQEGTLIVGSTGQVDANINVAAAVVNGTVNGDINASEKLELGRTARVVGNIKSPRLVISDGAILEGSCSMIEPKEKFEQRSIEQQQKFATSELADYGETNSDESEIIEETDSETFLEDATEETEEENAEAAVS